MPSANEMPNLRAVGEIGLHAVRRFFARQAPVGLNVARLELSFQPDGQDLLITAAYILDCPEDSKGAPLAFDFTQTSLALEGFACDVATIDPNPGPGAPKHAFPGVFLKAGAHWNGARIELTLRWKREGWAALRCLVVPDAFPTILRSFREGDRLPPRTLVQIHGADHGEVLRIGGVPAPPEVSVSGADLLQAIVIRKEESLEVRDGAGRMPVIFSNSVIAGLRSDEPRRMANMTRAIMRYLTDAFGIDPGAVLVAKQRNDLTHIGFLPHGACFNASPESFGYGPALGTPADFNLSAQLAGVWWRAGCKIVGRGALELESAICLAYALRWMDYIGEFDQLDEAVDRCSRFAKSSIVRNWWKGARGMLRSRDAGRVALRLYEALQDEHSAVSEVMEQMTRQHWGRYVHRHVITEALADAGLKI